MNLGFTSYSLAFNLIDFIFPIQKENGILFFRKSKICTKSF